MGAVEVKPVSRPLREGGPARSSLRPVQHEQAWRDETLRGASVAVMFRCCIFGFHRSRCMGVTPSPIPVWDEVVKAVHELLSSTEFMLPNLEQCKTYL